MSPCMAFIFGGQYEWIILLFVALMLFGKRLPEVARSMGKGLTEFKKGIRGVEDDVHGATSYDAGPTAERPIADDDLTNVSAPKFTPPAFDIDPAHDADGTPDQEAGSDVDADTDAGSKISSGES